MSLWLSLALALALAGQAVASGEVVIGGTVSRTGPNSTASVLQFTGLELWRDLVNAESGILIGGERYTVQIVSYDDGSDPARVPELYERLIHHDHADFLISSYSSAMGMASAAVAEEHDMIILLPGSAADEIFSQGFSRVYQITKPSSRYLVPALELLARHAPEVPVALVYEDDPFAVNAVEAARELARQFGLNIAFDRSYPAGATDLGGLVADLSALGPVAVVGGGHLQDGIALAEALAEAESPVPFLVLISAPSFPEFAEIGEGALGAMYPSQWEPGVDYRPTYGPTSAEFERAFEERYGSIPSYLAAAGFNTGLVLQYALEQAGTLDAEAVARALDETDIVTFYGNVRFDTGFERHGLQIGDGMVLVQLQAAPDGKIVKEVVWPRAVKTAELVFPKP